MHFLSFLTLAIFLLVDVILVQMGGRYDVGIQQNLLNNENDSHRTLYK